MLPWITPVAVLALFMAIWRYVRLSSQIDQHLQRNHPEIWGSFGYSKPQWVRDENSPEEMQDREAQSRKKSFLSSDDEGSSQR